MYASAPINELPKTPINSDFVSSRSSFFRVIFRAICEMDQKRKIIVKADDNAERIFIIENVISAKGEDQLWGNSPVPLGPALQRDFPHIERFVRMNQQWITVRSGDNFFNESVHFVDEGFFQMFTFPLKYGNNYSLSNQNTVILDEKTAFRYYGNVNPIGKQLTFIFNEGTIANTHFVAIPFNAAHKEAAMVVANFLISPEAQLVKADIEQWGDFPAIDITRLEPKWQQKFAALPRGVATLPDDVLQAHQLPEPPSEILIRLEKGWDRHVLKGR